METQENESAREVVAQKVRWVYTELDTLRKQYGRKVTVFLGERAVFAHHADLDLSGEEMERGGQIFEDLNTEDGIFTYYHFNHHPYLLLLNTLRPRWNQDTVHLLPGETYRIYQDGDDQIVRVECGTPSPFVFPLTKDHVAKFMTAFSVDPSSPEGKALLALV